MLEIVLIDDVGGGQQLDRIITQESMAIRRGCIEVIIRGISRDHHEAVSF